MTKNIYRTAQGQAIDIDNLKTVNENVVAVGNMNVNARGDRVSSDGTILETRNQIMKRRYGAGITVVSDLTIAKTPMVEKKAVEVTNPIQDEVVTPGEVVDTTPAPEPTVVVNNNLRGSLASQVASSTVVDGGGLNDLSLPVTKLKRI